MTTLNGSSRPQPSPADRAAASTPYLSPRPPGEIDLWLNGNEGAAPPAALLEALRARGPETLRRYPNAGDLTAQIARRFGVSADRVLVTAGADDALYRACLATLAPGRQIVLSRPTFEMLPRYAALAGGDVRTVDWLDGPYPLYETLAQVTANTAAIAIVSPNNPTGLVATRQTIETAARFAPHALILADLAYIEFADEDPTGWLLDLPNVLITRTFSKAWGLAGLRVGYALGPTNVIEWLRRVGNPYAVSGPSLAVASAWLADGQAAVDAFVARVRVERTRLTQFLASRGVAPLPGQANFVAARFDDAEGVWRGLAQRGIAVRAFPGSDSLCDLLRITCPGNSQDFDRLIATLNELLPAPAPTRVAAKQEQA